MKNSNLLITLSIFFSGGCPLFSQDQQPDFIKPIIQQTSVLVTKPLSAGWTWFSLNVAGADMSVANVLSSLVAQDGDFIKNQTVSSTYNTGVGWFGELIVIDPKEMYKIKLSQAG